MTSSSPGEQKLLTLSVDDIIVEDRLRKEFDPKKMTELIKSLKSVGQLEPIIVVPKDGKYYLEVGERRLRAIKIMVESKTAPKYGELGKIIAVTAGDEPTFIRLQREYDENDKREELGFVARAKFIRRFHEEAEKFAASLGKKWKAYHTAAALGVSQASISEHLKIEAAVDSDPYVAKASTIKAAVKRIKVQEQLKVREEAAKQNKDEAYNEAKQILRHGDALKLIHELPDGSVTLVNFDPPWGDEVGHKSNQNWEAKGAFDDSTEYSDSIINTLLPLLYKKMAEHSFLIFWYRTWAYEDMKVRLEKTGFSIKFSRTPNVWYKPDKTSDENRYPEKQLIDQYENFFIVRKGDAVFRVRNLGNVFVFPRVPRAKLIHPTEKPLELMKTLVDLCTIPGEMVLDPTAGSAAILHACVIHNRRCLGFEFDENNHKRSLLRLTEAMELYRRVK